MKKKDKAKPAVKKKAPPIPAVPSFRDFKPKSYPKAKKLFKTLNTNTLREFTDFELYKKFFKYLYHDQMFGFDGLNVNMPPELFPYDMFEAHPYKKVEIRYNYITQTHEPYLSFSLVTDQVTFVMRVGYSQMAGLGKFLRISKFPKTYAEAHKALESMTNNYERQVGGRKRELENDEKALATHRSAFIRLQKVQKKGTK